MAIGLSIRFADGTAEQYDAINAEMGVEERPAGRTDLPRGRPDQGRLGHPRLLGVARPVRHVSRESHRPGGRRARRRRAAQPSRDQGVPGPQHHAARRTEMGLNLASILTESAAEHPDAPAIRLGDDELTYGALDDASARLATLLREKGHRAGRPGRRDAAQRARVPGRLLRRAAGRAASSCR